MWLPQENFNQNIRGNCRRQLLKLNLTLNKQWNWSSSTKLTVSASWTQLELLNRIQWSKVQIPLTSTFYSYFRALQWWIPYIIYMKNILLLHFKILLFWTTVFSKRQEKLVPCINGKKLKESLILSFADLLLVSFVTLTVHYYIQIIEL